MSGTIKSRWPIHRVRMLAVVCLAATLGCHSNTLRTEYGDSTGYAGRDSINGFGGLRKLYEDVGWRTRTITRLNQRARRLDAIVWIPSTPTGIQKDATDWLESWMRDGKKTLVYVTYDGTSDAAYWRQAAEQASAEQRLEYRRRLARAQQDQLRRQLNLSVPESNGWLDWERLEPPAPINTEQIGASRDSIGPTDDEDAGGPGDTSMELAALEAPLTLQVELRQTQPQDTSANGKQATGGAMATTTPTLPWITQLDKVAEPSRTEVEFQPALALDSGPPLIAKITSPTWGESKVLVVAGGTLLDNFALTTTSGRKVAATAVGESGDAAQVGFLHTDRSPLAVDEAGESSAARNGMELLVVWPISLITIHAALLGIVVVLILMPVFGRPRRIKQPSQTDFADHLDAVATWMQRAPDDTYARQRISEYMRRVRGETSGKWVLPESTDRPPDRRAGE